MMTTIIRTNPENADFITLVQHLDRDLWSRYGDEQSFFDQFNQLDNIRHVVVAYHDERPMGCGAIKQYDEKTVEVKRMYVVPEMRGQGIALQILDALELWTRELSFDSCILETGVAQPEAIRLYEKAGYKIIPNFGQYAGVESSVCMKKLLDTRSILSDLKTIL